MTRPTNLGKTWPSRMVSSGPVTIGIGDLTDIDLSGIADGDIIIWDAGSNTWIVGPQTGGSSSMWVPMMVEDGATGLWYVAVTGDGDAVMVEVP